MAFPKLRVWEPSYRCWVVPTRTYSGNRRRRYSVVAMLLVVGMTPLELRRWFTRIEEANGAVPGSWGGYVIRAATFIGCAFPGRQTVTRHKRGQPYRVPCLSVANLRYGLAVTVASVGDQPRWSNQQQHFSSIFSCLHAITTSTPLHSHLGISRFRRRYDVAIACLHVLAFQLAIYLPFISTDTLVG